MSVYEENEILRILNSLCDVSLDRFDDRLRLQKLGYLAQGLGASGGFTFSWYIRGPYSSSLTKMLYGAEQVGILGKRQSLSDDEKRVVANLKKLLKNDLENPQTLELYASVWYLLPKKDTITREDKSYVLDRMKDEKPRYTKADVRNAMDAIIQFKNRNKI